MKIEAHPTNRARLEVCKQINRSHTHREREQQPRHRHTHTRPEQHPKPSNEHLLQTLNNARRWRDDGAAISHARVGGRAEVSVGGNGRRE